MSRHAHPIQLHVLTGNKCEFSKKEIAERTAAEIHFGSRDFRMPAVVRKDKIAKAKWKEVIKLYTDYDVDFVSTSDVAIIERYCMTYSEYMKLLGVRAEIEKVATSKGADPVSTFKAQNSIGIDNAINKKSAALTALEDRLFLNPLAKIKNIPKKEKEPEKAIQEQKAMFGD